MNLKDNRVVNYLKAAKTELRKVTWPTPQEAWQLTRVVIVTMILMSAILGLLDFVFTQLIAFILS